MIDDEDIVPITNITLYKENSGLGYNDQEMYISHTFGDPHIQPANGGAYELPKEAGIYRILQGVKIVVNARTRKLTEKEKEEIVEHYRKVGFKNTSKVVTDGTYYSDIAVISEGHRLNYILEHNAIVYNDGQEYFNLISDNKGTIIEINHSVYGLIHILCRVSKNPQIKHSLGLIAKKDRTLKGPLIEECDLEQMRLTHINDKNKCVIVKKKNPVYSKLRKF
jgi:hypothetical protein